LGTAVAKPVAKKPPGRNVNRRLRGDAVEETAQRRSASAVKADTFAVLQEILDGKVEDMRYTQSKVDALKNDELWRTTMVGKIPNEWIRLRDEYREKTEALALKLVNAGLADRAVRVQEAQMVLLAQRIQAAAERAGLDAEQRRALGRELRSLAEEAGEE
jgi:hypothetical protein